MKKRSVRVLFACALALAVGCFTAACKEHEHEYTQVVTPPTCTERGYTTYSCACGESYDDNYVEALDHDWGEGEVTEEPTCTEAGEETFTCSRCGESKTETAEALGHTPAAAVRENEKAATCEEAGSYDEVVYCSVCEDELSRETKVIAETGHSFTNYVSDGNATCTENGTETAKCDHCGETDTREEEDSATGHTPAAAVRENEKAATCEEAGSYEEVVYCSVCEVEISRETKVITAPGHTPAAAVRENEKAATCEEAGSYVEVVSCSVCEKELSRETKVITALGHSFTNYVSNNDATCTQDGTETAKCDRCDKTDTRTDEGSATGHTPAAAVRENEVAATCEEAGSYDEVVYCSVCGEEISREEKVITAPGHTPAAAVRENEKAATCEEAGSYDEVVYCSVCEDEISRETKVIAETGHSFTNYVSDGNATCTENGTETAKCDHCDETDTREEEDSATGHTPAAAVRENEKAATCEEAGSYEEVVYCSVCEVEISRETKVITAPGHTPAAAVRENEKAATCEEAGSYEEVVYCSVCEEELSRETKVITETGHSFTNYVSDGNATCTENGTETAKCDNGCGETHTREEEDSAKGHTPGEVVCDEAQTCTVCGEELAPAPGHDWDDGEVIIEPGCIFDGTMLYTCSRCEETYRDRIPAEGHTPGAAATCTTAQRCVECGMVLTPAYDHNWNAGTVTKEPTCTETGLKLVSCTRCGATKTETVEETGHSFTKYVSDDNATCTADGTETAKCDNGCGETHTRDEADSAKGHELTYTAAVAPTCEAAGTVEYWSCSRCKKNFADEDATKELTDITDPATGHDLTYTAEVAASCEDAGTVEHWSCSNCNKYFADEDATVELMDLTIPAKRHSWSTEWTSDDDSHWHVCTVCNAVDEATKAAHTPGLAATCTTAQTCTVCGYVIEEELGHNYVEHVCSRCYAIEMVGQANIPVGNTVAVHDPSIIVAYADADGALYPDAGENRQKMYFIFGTQLAAAYSYDMESWLMFTPTFYAENTETVSDDYTKIFASAAAWPGYADADTIKGNLWAPDIIYNKKMGKWCLYYSMSGDSSNFRSSIFMMTSDNLTGPYEFVDFVVFSGFNKGTGAGVDDYKNVTRDQSVPSRYSNNKNEWNNDYGVSCIDPSVLYDKNGELWLNYGSWSGGIFLLKLDEATGLRQVGYDYGYDGVTYDATKTDALVYDPYLGVHIAGGWYVSGEGPYIAYMNGYYYLFLSYGFYSPEGGYNMRVFRSSTINGRYEDMNGNWAVYTDAESNSGINYGGNVSKGEVLMQNYKWSWWTGPASLAQGHNSVLVDGDKAYLIYHIKYDNGTAHHNVEVHELVFGENDWPLAAPFQKSEDDKVVSVDRNTLAGSWSVILHTPVDYKNLKFNTDSVITLEAGGTVSGAYTGTWSLNRQYITITLHNNDGSTTTYTGVVMEQQIEGLAGKNVAYTFTATNASTNTPLWGVKNPEGKSAADSVLNSLVLPGEILASINLPTTGDFGTTISYSSNNTDVLSNEGVYTAPTGDTEVTLTVKVTSSDYSDEKAFTINVLSEVSANAMVEKIVPEELTIDDFIVAKAAPLAGETVAPVSAINASTGVSLTFRVENIGSDWDVIFRAPGKDAIVYLSVLNYLGVDIFETAATLSPEGVAILEAYYEKNPLADPDKDPIKDGASNWMLFLGSLCDNEDKSCIATISYNVDGSITFYRDGVLMLTYAATTKIGKSTVGALSKYMAEQVGSYGLEVVWPVEDLIIGYAADYTGACEHSYGAYEGDTATCIYCGGTKVRVEVGEKTYEAEFVSRANAEKVNNTDTSGGWESWVPVGSKWVSGDFAVQYSWANTRDTNFYHDVALQLQTGGNYFTMNMLNGSAAWGTLATAEGVTHQGTVTKNGVETTAPAISSNPVGFSCEGVYTATMIRIGNVLIVRQTIALTSGDVWEAFDTFSGITQDDLYVELTANPYWADDIRVAVGTLTEVQEEVLAADQTLGKEDNSTAYTGATPLWTGSISQGQRVTATGTATCNPNPTEGSNPPDRGVWNAPLPYIWTGAAASLNFRPDNWVNGDGSQETYGAFNFAITKTFQGFTDTSLNGTDWTTTLVNYYNVGEYGCTIVWDYTASDVIVITFAFDFDNVTYNQRYEIRATGGKTLLETYSIGLGVDYACFKVDSITRQ